MCTLIGSIYGRRRILAHRLIVGAIGVSVTRIVGSIIYYYYRNIGSIIYSPLTIPS